MLSIHPNSTKPPPGAPTNKLRARGIASVAERAGWQPHNAGWRFPVPELDGNQTAWRWKAYDSAAKLKYQWPDGKPSWARYYVPFGADALRAAIADADGVLYIANGEPGLLSYHAAGMANVLCWFDGEGSVPHDFAQTLKALGVSRVRYPADKDAAGTKSAIKVRDALKGSGIAFTPLQWSADLPDKADANDLWQAVQFDAEQFRAVLDNLSALLLPIEEPQQARRRIAQSPTSTTSKRDAIEAVEVRLGVKGYKPNGWSLNVPCPFHEDRHASAGLHQDGSFKCFVCGTFEFDAVAAHFGIEYAVRPKAERPKRCERGASGTALAEAPEEPSAGVLRLWQIGRLMIVCPEYVLLHLHALALGKGDDFTAADIADSACKSKDAVQKWIDSALDFELISEFSAELKRSIGTQEYLFKNAENSTGRPERHYKLTPHRADEYLSRNLWKHVLEPMEAPTPAPVGKDEMLTAGLDDETAARLELITQATSETDDAFEVNAKAERRAVEKAREILWLAESDDTPFTPDVLPTSVRELRTMLIDALIDTDPGATWLHSKLMWIAGVKRGSVSALIAKSTKYAPADTPTFKNVPIEGDNLRKAAAAAARKEGGAPVAWGDANGDYLAPFSQAAPGQTATVRLNCGKTYVRRVDVPKEATAPTPAPAPTPRAIDSAERAQRQARRDVLPRLRGCLLARGWQLTPGPYGEWTRHGETISNTFEGIVAATQMDYEWAVEQSKDDAPFLAAVAVQFADVQMKIRRIGDHAELQ